MTTHADLIPANQLAQQNAVRFLNEGNEYRIASNAWLAKEIELRRHIERVAAQRRALPAGGEVKKRYGFEGESGPVNLVDLFGDKQTPAIL